MKLSLVRPWAAVLVAVPLCLIAATMAFADTKSINFEPTEYSPGNINGQDGWQKTGGYDVEVETNTYGIGAFDDQTLRMSNAVTSGSFGDQTFSKPLTDEAGEAVAENGGQSGGTRQNRFEAQFDLASATTTQQPGLAITVSPDRGDGARMSFLRFEDQADGIHVIFFDVQGTTDPANFVSTDIATLDRAQPHTIKFVMDFVAGPSNDVVQIYIDGNLEHTGTSWENYYRFDNESNPAAPSDTSRTVDSLLFRAGGAAAPATMGAGFLVDNMQLKSSTVTPAPVTVTINKYIDGAMATSGSASGASFPMTASWDAANIGAGSGSYELDADGFNGNPTPYQAITSEMTSGASYSTSELSSGSSVGASCADGKPFALAGYSWGDTLAAAEAAPIGSSSPAFTNIATNKVVLVHNEPCAVVPPAPTSSQVTIIKYVDGVHATAGNASSTTFDFTATYNASNIGAGSDPFTIGPTGNNTPNAYEAMTIPLANGASYNATENISSAVGASCADGKPFAIGGYTSGATLVAAQAGTVSSTSPSFTNLQTNQYVIVWNRTCEAPTPPPAPLPTNACATPTVAPPGYTLRNGTSKADSVTLAPNTMFVGKGGADSVTGPAGNYIVCLGSAADSVSLGAGQSVVDAGNGANSITLGNGAGHYVVTGSAADTITTGNGNDTINAGNGHNVITTRGGDDSITTGSGADSVNAGAGTDTCSLGGGNNNATSCEL